MITLTIPGRVWDDFLNPDASGMAAEIGLPAPRVARRGKGHSFVYENVTPEQAEEVAGYLHDRGDTLLNQGVSDPYDSFEKASRATYGKAKQIAEEIRRDLLTRRPTQATGKDSLGVGDEVPGHGRIKATGKEGVVLDTGGWISWSVVSKAVGP